MSGVRCQMSVCMGHKIHPKAFRLGTVRTWDSHWFARKNFPALLRQDVMVRAWLLKTLREASVERVDIERSGAATTVIIHTAKPGFIIGRAGTGAEELKRKLIAQFWKGAKKPQLQVNIVETQRPALAAQIVADQATLDIEKRMPHRRLMKQIIERVLKGGGLGVKVRMAGRLGGAEIARREVLSSGTIPLNNLRADIDYGEATAHTVYGTIGVKVWIYKGEVFEKK